MKSAFPFGIFLAFLVVMSGFTALNSLHSHLDHDTWWHLRVGKFVCETGTVPQVDFISRHGIDNQVPWRAYSWLHEVILFQVFQFGGITALMWFKTLLTFGSAATVFAFVLRQSGTTLIGLVSLAGMALLIYPMGTERPWHITMAFTTFTLWKTVQLREGGSILRAWWMLPMFVIWANTHIQFVLGWGILGLAFLFPARAKRWQLGCLTAACILITIVNPYHVWLFQVIWEYATQNDLRKYVQELRRPDPLSRFTITTNLILATAFVRAILRKPRDGFAFSLILAGAVFANRMTRDMWFGVLLAVTVMYPPGEVVTTWKRLMQSVLTVAVVYLFARSLFCLGLLPRWSNNYEASHEKLYPVKAVEFLRERKPKGPLFNDFDWGGYLSWKLPEYPVSLDGRTNLYGDKLLELSWNTWLKPGASQQDATFLASNIVLAEKAKHAENTDSTQPRVDSVLASELRLRTDRWELVYEDAISCIFLRK
jgi:hypothetical protein